MNTLIAKMKRVLTHSINRTQIYQELLGDQPSLPEPVITRWRTFLNAAVHHHHKFDKTKIFVSSFDAGAADSTALKSIVEDPDLQVQLREIARFAILPKAIEELECRSLPMENKLVIYRSLEICWAEPYASRLT